LLPAHVTAQIAQLAPQPLKSNMSVELKALAVKLSQAKAKTAKIERF